MIRCEPPARRSGFTLVEMLVAIGLAVVVLGIGAAVTQTSAFDSHKIVGAADKLSQYMLVAKNRALRDRAPRGIRLIPDTTNPDFIKEIAYIEQPDPIPSNGPLLIGSRLVFYYPVQVVDNTMSPPPIYIFDNIPAAAAMGLPAGKTSPTNQRALYLAGLTAAQQAEFTATIQPNDLISIPELRTVLKLGNPAFTIVTPANVPSGATIQLNVLPLAMPDLGQSVYSLHHSSTQNGTAHPNIPFTTSSGTLTVNSFGIIRSARPILGEPTQQLPYSMAVDVRSTATTSLNPPPADTNGNRDILFAPSGEVIGSAESLTLLLVRDVNLPNVVQPLTTDFERAGQMILICLYNKTGAISTQPVNPPPATDPYRFAKDGINTGL